MKDTLVRHSDVRMFVQQQLTLQLGKAPTDLNDIVTRPFVHVRMLVAYVVEDILRQSAVARSNLINDEVFVRKVLEQVLSQKTLRYRLAVPRLISSQSALSAIECPRSLQEKRDA